MAKAKPEWEHKLMANRWVFFLLAVIFLAIGYGFASLAIDSAHIWAYVLAIVFFVWAVKELYRGVHNLIRK